MLAAVGWRAGTKPNADGVAAVARQRHLRAPPPARPARSRTLDIAANPHADGGRPADAGAHRPHRAGHRQRRRPEPPHRLRARPGRGEVQRRRRRRSTPTRTARRAPPQSDYLNGVWVSTDFGATWTRARGLDDDRQRHDERLGAGAADVQGARRHRLLPGHPGLVQPLGPARPDAQTAAGVPDAARLRPRGGLGNDPRERRRPASTARRRRSSTSSAATSPATPARCSAPPTGCRSARRRRRAAASRRPRRTPTSTARCSCPTAGRGVTLFAGNDGGVYTPARRRRRRRSANDEWGNGSQHRPAHAAALRRRDGQGRHGLHGPAGQRRGQDRARRQDATRSTAATASSPRSTPTTPNIAYEEYVGGVISVTDRRRQDWTTSSPG